MTKAQEDPINMAHARSTINRLPDEVLELIFIHATAYTEEDYDLHPFWVSKHLASVANKTKTNLSLVSRKWNRIVSSHLYRDVQIHWRSYPKSQDSSSVQLRRFASRLLESTLSGLLPSQRTRTFTFYHDTSLQLENQVLDWPALARAGTDLCFILSHVTLSRFATNLDPIIPWLSILSCKSAYSLTHLDVAIPPGGVSPTFVRQLNRFVNLVWLRISDVADQARNGGDVAEALDDLPVLSLPRLQDLQLRCAMLTDDVHPDGGIPFHIGRYAILPSLDKLSIEAGFLWRDDVATWVLERLGSSIRELHLEAYCDCALDNLQALAPNLVHLTCIVSEEHAREASAEIDRNLNHALLRQLDVSGRGYYRPMLKNIAPERVPNLACVRFVDIKWRDLPMVDWDMEEEHDGMGYFYDIDCAAELALKGILVLDREGQAFGGLNKLEASKRLLE
ncbi:hypothetical protein PUNSTDRAFT_143284 [Punctularia strigosozonata HHB-11173 SS5]|uniref:uncharacterized protein n=1 Tax=Punctularia strigosozonata (strain HHB-11173) TaxID=741275 RepID=UPI0004417282|nr:uncharacterized protein PUNSTDRAFT_143284 [Punctularia strigosozonata HHB-11173 SS5]EIN09872.1 hypothetical protein PUNSTDRAFT_143284 [Punctularia strigosozonata HHB-11173 SS5]